MEGQTGGAKLPNPPQALHRWRIDQTNQQRLDRVSPIQRNRPM
jgi:hypothetical protein